MLDRPYIIHLRVPPRADPDARGRQEASAKYISGSHRQMEKRHKPGLVLVAATCNPGASHTVQGKSNLQRREGGDQPFPTDYSRRAAPHAPLGPLR